jgi:hypothetical protein
MQAAATALMCTQCGEPSWSPVLLLLDNAAPGSNHKRYRR